MRILIWVYFFFSPNLNREWNSWNSVWCFWIWFCFLGVFILILNYTVTFLIRDVERIIYAVYLFTHPAIYSSTVALIQCFVTAEICDIYCLCQGFMLWNTEVTFLRLLHLFQHWFQLVSWKISIARLT